MTATQSARSQSEHILALAEELMSDIEVRRIEPDAVLQKATRLARLTSATGMQAWLRFEMFGYVDLSKSTARYWGLRTGRLVGGDASTWRTEPLAEIMALARTAATQQQSLRIPDFGEANGLARGVIAQIMEKASQLRTLEARYAGIQIRVLGIAHDFAAGVYYERVFSGVAESVFERYKQEVDQLLAINCGDVLERIPSIYDRLAEGDREAISGALNTCRRILAAFADAVYASSDKPIDRDGEKLNVKRDNYLNRINEYVRQVEPSSTRRQRLKQTLRAVNERASAGVHDDVTVEEAQALFLNTYMTIGEIARMAGGPPRRIPTVVSSEDSTLSLDEN